jgi:2-oxoisovalerate dehydrogenase E1 component
VPQRLDRSLRTALAALREPPPPRPDAPSPPGGREELLDLLTAQLRSRCADLVTRELRARGAGYYSIASAGHEADAAVAAALRPTDPALLHDRSGAFHAARAQQVGGIDPVRDVLLGVMGAAADPVSGGRHKVIGRHELAIVPQTSTIASHLPRAVGLAFALGRARRLGVEPAVPPDSVVVCSLGDASVNHSTATGAVNAAVQAAYRGLAMPLLLVGEDNGLGISTPTPAGWVEHALGARPGLRYLHVPGTGTWETLVAARELAGWVRRHRRPALLHLDAVRFLGHAGTDVESAYRTAADVTADLARDPLAVHARDLVAHGLATADELLALYDDVLAHARTVAAEVERLPQLPDAAAVTEPLTRTAPDAVRLEADRIAAHPAPGGGQPQTLAQAIGGALRQVLAAVPGAMVFGEDVAAKGGVYGVTRGLQQEAGGTRVFDTLLDEQTVLGLGLGAGLAGLLPLPEIQYLAYLHNAEDQLRGEGATQAFFSAGRYTNPMVVRVPGYAYQKGFGGHFHNDNSVAVLRDVPGLVVASPALPDDAAAVLRTCAAVAAVEGRVCVFLEPIALYHQRDLHADGDGGWLAVPDEEHVPVGRARTHGAGTDLTVVTFGNGLRLSLRAARALEREGVGVRVVDLRWLVPLPVDDVLREARTTGRVLVVDETRRSGGVSEGVVTALVDHGFTGPMARVAALDSFVPLGAAADLVLVQEADVLRAARDLLARG